MENVMQMGFSEREKEENVVSVCVRVKEKDGNFNL